MKAKAPKWDGVVICDYCDEPAAKVDSAEVYPNRPGLHGRVMYLCRDCDAWVGCHPGTDRPLGRLADAPLRKGKSAVHELFDPMWERRLEEDRAKQARDAKHKPLRKYEARGDAYEWLAAQLGIHGSVCHIGMFDLETCRRAWRILNAVQRGKIMGPPGTETLFSHMNRR